MITNLTPPTDSELVTEARCGDHQAITELFRRYRKVLVTVCRGIAGVDGEDALQNVMMSFPERLQSFDSERGPFRAWIIAVARREAVRVARRRSSLGGRPVVYTDSVSLERPTVGDEPAARTVGRAELLGLLGSLSPRHRYVLLASCVLCIDDADIAADLSVDETTIRTIRSKARAQLATVLARETSDRRAS